MRMLAHPAPRTDSTHSNLQSTTLLHHASLYGSPSPVSRPGFNGLRKSCLLQNRRIIVHRFLVAPAQQRRQNFVVRTSILPPQPFVPFLHHDRRSTDEPFFRDTRRLVCMTATAASHSYLPGPPFRKLRWSLHHFPAPSGSTLETDGFRPVTDRTLHLAGDITNQFRHR